MFVQRSLSPARSLSTLNSLLHKSPSPSSSSSSSPTTSSSLACVNVQSTRSIISSPYPSLPVINSSFSQFLFQDLNEDRSRKAVIHSEDDRYLTFGDVERGARNLASALMKANQGKPPIVLTNIKNCPEYFYLYCAAGFNACVLSPADSNYKANDIARQINTSGAEFVFTDLVGLNEVMLSLEQCPQIKQVILTYGQVPSELTKRVIHLDTWLNDNGSAMPDQNSSIDWSQQLLMLPFSSGTTGLPKGVKLSHTNINMNILQTNFMFNSKGCENAMGVLPLYHIYGAVPIAALNLKYRSTLITLPAFTPQAFVSSIDKYQINVLPIVPPIVHMLNHMVKLGHKINFTSVRRVTIGAAPLDRESEKHFLDNFSSQNATLQVAQGYGLTETSPVIATMPDKSIYPGDKHGTCGQLLPNIQAKIVNVETQEEVGENEEGELLIRGPNVMLGYWQNAEADQQIFTADGWMRTGDIVRFDEDGFLVVEDRIKELIKYKGRQVAPAELEAILIQHPHVMDAAVVGKADKLAGELPTAFICLQENLIESEDLLNDVHKFVNEHVAPHKQLRGGIIVVKTIPKSAAGKILRRKLKETLTTN